MVLRRRDLRRERHETDAALGEGKVQEDQHRQAAQLHHPPGKEIKSFNGCLFYT